MSIIEVSGVSKAYPLRQGKRAILGRGGLEDFFRGTRSAASNVLDNVSLQIEAGESIGIIGRNGSGKSTLLKILAGVTLPTSGDVTVRGRVASLLELGAGFHPMLTGRENIYLNAGLLGMRHAAVNMVFDQIVAFSGIEAYIDQPVDTYSSGMYVRIAFAVAVHVNPDIFLVDEVLAVGDEEFQRKCRTKIGELKKQGKTILFVSHDLGSINTLCDRVLLLHQGAIIARNSAQETINYYLRLIGRETGIHTMRGGDAEAVFNHGRLALFHGGKEITAPNGVQVVLNTLGQYHSSTDAEWIITEKSPASCTAEGTLSRLPIVVLLDISVGDDSFFLHATLRIVHSVSLDLCVLMLNLQPQYNRWYYGPKEGAFPEILPSHLEWSNIVPAAAGVIECAVSAPSASDFPALVCSLTHSDKFTSIDIYNSDYMSGARVIQVSKGFPRSDGALAPGNHEIAQLTIDPSMRLGEIDAWKKQQQEKNSIFIRNICARWSNGSLLLFQRDILATVWPHLHCQMLIAGLWTLSTSLQWQDPESQGESLYVSGESPRFPVRQHWQLAAVEDGLAIKIHFEALEELVLEEGTVSMALDPAYEAWATAYERGSFPPFDTNQVSWRHLNSNYSPSEFIEASASILPSVRLQVAPGTSALRMSAIDTGYAHQARVLQAIHAPREAAGFTLLPNSRVLMFDLVVSFQEKTQA